jgi:hypothetical protein
MRGGSHEGEDRPLESGSLRARLAPITEGVLSHARGGKNKKQNLCPVSRALRLGRSLRTFGSAMDSDGEFCTFIQ